MSLSKLLTFLFTALLGLGLIAFLGCPPPDDDDSAADDDDATDDDDDDTATPFWFYYSFSLEMTGGEPNATGTLYLEIVYYEGDSSAVGDEICSQTMAFDATATVGLGVHEAYYWQFIDTVIEWSGPGTEVENTCYWDPDELYGVGWDEAMAWDNELASAFNPLAMVSCDTINGNPTLADTTLGPDPYGWVSEETFGGHCDEAGSMLEDSYGFGPMEGIWMLPMTDGWLGTDYEYFEPDDTSVVPVWGFFGWFLNDPENSPAAGLDGMYYSITGWVLGG